MIDWDLVEQRVIDCRGIAFDTCHKIYVLMDDEQIVKMREYEYDPLITIYQMGNDEMLDTIKTWYADSCSLRFVEAVSTMPDGEDPNLGFETLIEQGASDVNECYYCGEEYCDGECETEDEEDEDEDE